ncbi:hypothetical protein [Streptomyces roseoviridis]|uniref:Uncharacterized protein n=1 Tax=Streptomyces roseoviridis TaxID=67361 RepID=A0ABV5QHI6_9ACTN
MGHHAVARPGPVAPATRRRATSYAHAHVETFFSTEKCLPVAESSTMGNSSTSSARTADVKSAFVQPYRPFGSRCTAEENDRGSRRGAPDPHVVEAAELVGHHVTALDVLPPADQTRGLAPAPGAR